MKVLFDLNILLDVMQQRAAFYEASAAALSKALQGECAGIIPCHAITTLHYLLTRYVDKQKADEGTDFLLENLEVASADTETFRQARRLDMKDFEDAVVASVAIQTGCQMIVTRNTGDFRESPVPALLPEEFIARFHEQD